MAFSDLQATVMAGVFDPDRFGVSVTYNGGDPITAIVEYGSESDEAGDSVKTQATLLVSVSDVADPGYRDSIVIDSATWRMRKVLEGYASHWALLIEKGERPVI